MGIIDENSVLDDEENQYQYNEQEEILKTPAKKGDTDMSGDASNDHRTTKVRKDTEGRDDINEIEYDEDTEER